MCSSNMGVSEMREEGAFHGIEVAMASDRVAVLLPKPLDATLPSTNVEVQQGILANQDG